MKCLKCGHAPLGPKNRSGMCDVCGKNRECRVCRRRKPDTVKGRCDGCRALHGTRKRSAKEPKVAGQADRVVAYADRIAARLRLFEPGELPTFRR